MNISRGMLLTDPPSRAGVMCLELINSYLKGRDDSATVSSMLVHCFPRRFQRTALQGLQVVGMTCALPEA
jgi:hypothetical protein